MVKNDQDFYCSFCVSVIVSGGGQTDIIGGMMIVCWGGRREVLSGTLEIMSLKIEKNWPLMLMESPIGTKSGYYSRVSTNHACTVYKF